MRARNEHVLHKVLFFGTVRRNALAAAMLRTVFRRGQTLDISEMGHGYNHVFALDEVAYIYLVVVYAKLGFSRRCVFFFYFVKLGLNYLFHSEDWL